jgi:hypothetical protein
MTPDDAGGNGWKSLKTFCPRLFHSVNEGLSERVGKPNCLPPALAAFKLTASANDLARRDRVGRWFCRGN